MSEATEQLGVSNSASEVGFSLNTCPRAIVHLDLDAFFAAVEVLENPDLADKPILIGGRPALRMGDMSGGGAPIVARAFTVLIGG